MGGDGVCRRETCIYSINFTGLSMSKHPHRPCFHLTEELLSGKWALSTQTSLTAWAGGLEVTE